MTCDQIRQYLGPYAEGSLPGYKAAWVVQHLAGCPACAAVAEEGRRRNQKAAAPRRTPVAATIPRPRPQAGFEEVPRSVPRWLQVATALLVVSAAGGAVWLFLGHDWGRLG